MKRIIYLFLTVCAVAVFGGWAAARVQASLRVRESAEKANQAKLASEAEAKKPALYFSRLAKDADEVVVSYHTKQGEHEVRLNDPKLISELSNILGSGSYIPRAHGLWVSSPKIRLYRTKVQILEMMALGAVLRAYGEEYRGDYFVGEEFTAAILALVKKSEPNQALEPTTLSVTPPATQEPRRP